jgi:hydrogenase-4 component B
MSSGPLLLFAGSALAVGLIAGRTFPRVWLAATTLGGVAGLVAAVGVLHAGAEWDWHGQVALGGEPVHLRLDAISAIFLALLGLVGALGTLYARAYWTDAAHPRSARAGRAWWSLLLLAMGLVLLASNGLHFLIAWELFTLASYFLITLERARGAARAAGWLYLAASHAATLCLFGYFATVAARTGSWELGPMRDEVALTPLFWLALAGFGVKAGLFPLHIWLPSAHASAPSHVSALMSGVTIKLGIYGLVRFSGWLPVPLHAGWVVGGLGVISAVLGVAFALGQHDLKRLLAYHSVENIGIILIGVGFALVAHEGGDARWGQLALAGGLWHVWNHGLFKSLLFLGAGSVLHATGTREMSRLGGLWRRMPWTTILFAVGAAAISGLPPFNGFVSEWVVYLGLFDAVNGHGEAALGAAFAAVLLALTGALALACFIKVGGVVFLGSPRTRAAEKAVESSMLMRGPMVVLALACVVIGVAPTFFWAPLARATAAWNPAWSEGFRPPSLGVMGACQGGLAIAGLTAAAALWWWTNHGGCRRSVTWDCGYAAPTARMQYTAGSFAGIITEWFDWILQPRREGAPPTAAFPVAAHWAEHTPETVLESVVAPAGRVVLQIAAAARGLQHGRVQAYLLYLLLGLAALTAVVLVGGKS